MSLAKNFSVIQNIKNYLLQYNYPLRLNNGVIINTLSLKRL